jgi:hypothetical protein
MDFSTIALGIIFAIANPWAFIELRRSAGARNERTKHAREELVGLLEAQLLTLTELTPEIVYKFSMGLSQKRDVKVGEIYRPIMVLHELLLRLRENPVIEPTRRSALEQQVDSVIRGLKRTEGLQLLSEATEAVKSSSRMSNRTRARDLLGQVADNWATFEDQATIARVRYVRTRLGSEENREAALDAVNTLTDRWRAGSDTVAE